MLLNIKCELIYVNEKNKQTNELFNKQNAVI